MGKRAKWFGAVKKVFGHKSKEKREKSKKKLGRGTSRLRDVSAAGTVDVSGREVVPSLLPHPDEDKVVEVEIEESNYANSLPLTPLDPPEPAVTTERDASHVTASSKFPGKTREEIAAVKIQTAFRGHLARRALRALRGLVRLKSLIDGNSVKRQATTTLRYMQMLARIQSQIRTRRIRMLEENQDLQRQMLLKHERELEILKMGEEWDDSLQTKEQLKASLLSKQEAAIRRERALAYAFSHQWKNSSKPLNPMFMDPNNLQWGWSWLERWMAERPLDKKSTTDRDLLNEVTTAKRIAQNDGGGDILRTYANRDRNSDKPSPAASQKPTRPASRQSPSTPPVKPPWSLGKAKSESPKPVWSALEDDSRSMVSMQSERSQGHSLAAASMRDDKSLSGSSTVPSYMATTKSAKAKSHLHSFPSDKLDSGEKSSVNSVKKRLSFPTGQKFSPASPVATRRNSGPPKVELASENDIESTGEASNSTKS
ncbi:protein IQ-DOMAIN 2-like [Zingiber officinale]|uniref:protein IQ-DOMAIN 2-like n=1 Tax=Zingiber officinale TaxID=94328 RepID=UPI001C4D7F16|nr:protein IQ-DOMAIN 2-like [Zingiber officinale]